MGENKAEYLEGPRGSPYCKEKGGHRRVPPQRSPPQSKFEPPHPSGCGWGTGPRRNTASFPSKEPTVSAHHTPPSSLHHLHGARTRTFSPTAQMPINLPEALSSHPAAWQTSTAWTLLGANVVQHHLPGTGPEVRGTPYPPPVTEWRRPRIYILSVGRHPAASATSTDVVSLPGWGGHPQRFSGCKRRGRLVAREGAREENVSVFSTSEFFFETQMG